MTGFIIDEERFKKYEQFKDFALETSEKAIQKFGEILFKNGNEEYLTTDIQSFIGYFLSTFSNEIIKPLVDGDENMPIADFLSTLNESLKHALIIKLNKEDKQCQSNK